MSNNSRACRLIQASNLAYSMSEDGTQFDPSPAVSKAIDAIGYIPSTLKFYQSPLEDGINACYYGETPTEAILTFRGTLPPTFESIEDFFKSLTDWINDAEIKLVKGTNLAGLVHKGFLESLDALWDWIVELKLEDAVARGKSLLVTGHSKGGALVYLAAYRLTQMRIPVQATYSYAAARAGDRAFADAFDRMVKTGAIKEAYRFEYQDDLVPHLPPETGAWRGVQKGLTSVQSKFPTEAPHMTCDPEIAQDVDRFLEQLDNTLDQPSYASAGELQFIDWNNNVVGDSFALSIERTLSLAKLMAEFEFERIIEDHSSDGGYMQVPCKP
ncbi:lipase family protein [Paraherbaspirillum soli]|uniref:Fungal lipase-type domain-containing protein n=1 Tax=Paraherbaspirillum soli TaxID=631222 RepID=A0ABW0M932_9BURK